ncbi:MAG: hypothetical protein ACYTGN_03300 [Planctomycetota bacterium]|jgi:hypothetical protein
MEGGTFLSREIQDAFKRFVMIELHTDGKSDETRESSIRNRKLQKERFKTVALPYYVLLDSNGKVTYWEGAGVFSEEEFLAKLKEVP